MIEIERKFLLKRLPAVKADDELTIEQFYTKESVRFRKWFSWRDGNKHYEKIQKINIGFGHNVEEDFEVSEEQYNKEYTQCRCFIKKQRYIYKKDGLKFEIDNYFQTTIITCEVELKDINEHFEFPSFIKELIIKEVTGEKEFNNYNLAEAPVV